MKAKYKKDRHASYYEAIIQLRQLDKKLYDWVKVDIERKGIIISKEEVSRNGFDIYIDSNQYAVALGKKLKKRFDGEVKLSRTLHSTHKMTSKQLYRVTLLFRMKSQEVIN